MMSIGKFIGLLSLSCFVIGCGSDKSSGGGGDEPGATEPQNRVVVFELSKEGCMKESDPPYNTAAFCSCFSGKTIERQVQKCGGNETEVNLPCELGEEELNAAAKSCF
jgi:hypothetical protein